MVGKKSITVGGVRLESVLFIVTRPPYSNPFMLMISVWNSPPSKKLLKVIIASLPLKSIGSPYLEMQCSEKYHDIALWLSSCCLGVYSRFLEQNFVISVLAKFPLDNKITAEPSIFL